MMMQDATTEFNDSVIAVLVNRVEYKKRKKVRSINSKMSFSRPTCSLHSKNHVTGIPGM